MRGNASCTRLLSSRRLNQPKRGAGGRVIGEAIALRASYRQGSSRRLRQVLAGRRTPTHKEADLCEMTFKDQTDCSATRATLLSLLQILDSDVHKNPL